MTYTQALLLAIACGAAVNVSLTVWSAWRVRHGTRQQSAGSFYVVLVAVLGVPLALAVAMPNFKTALVAALGFAVGYAVGIVLSLPLSAVLAARIARSTK